MQELEMKQKTAKEIIALMEQIEGDKLKAHPKLQKPVHEMADGSVMKNEDMKEGSVEEEKGESPLEEKAEGDEEISPEIIRELLEALQAKK